MTDLCWQTAFIYLSVCLSVYLCIYPFLHPSGYIYIYTYVYVCKKNITVYQLHTKPIPRNAHVILLPMPSHMYQSTTIWTLKHKSASANLAQT